MSFTTYLLNSDPIAFQAATRTPFLKAAGEGRLSKHQLSQWLSQERLYAQAYIGFIGSLLGKFTLPYTFCNDHSKSLDWMIVDTLYGALKNIYRELGFFAETANKYNLQLDCPAQAGPHFGPVTATKEYMDLLGSFAGPGTIIEPVSRIEGMTILWATERCYLSAWEYAKTWQKSQLNGGMAADADGGAIRNELIPIWTSEEFEDFVAELEGHIDDLAVREGAKPSEYIKTWYKVLDLEKRFWPEVKGVDMEHPSIRGREDAELEQGFGNQRAQTDEKSGPKYWALKG